MTNKDNSLDSKPKRNGRPPKWTNPELMEEAIQNYFIECDKRIIKHKIISKGVPTDIEYNEPYSMAGLADALGMHRDSLNHYKKTDDYAKWKEENPAKAEIFSAVISRARHKIERYLISRGLLGMHNPNISALNLGSNYGYSTKVEQDIKAEASVIINRISYKGASGIDFNKAQDSEAKG